MKAALFCAISIAVAAALCEASVINGVTNLNANSIVSAITPSNTNAVSGILATVFGVQTQAISTLISFIQSNGTASSSIVSIADEGYKKLGQAECNGLDGSNGIAVFSLIYNTYTGWDNGSQTDFGGDYLCPSQCSGGKCSPYTSIAGAPPSLYPFGCSCPSTSCNTAGPIESNPYLIPGVVVKCAPEEDCECNNMNLPQNTTYTGYICNWWNVELNSVVYLSLLYSPILSPIRWCTCCAQS